MFYAVSVTDFKFVSMYTNYAILYVCEPECLRYSYVCITLSHVLPFLKILFATHYIPLWLL